MYSAWKLYMDTIYLPESLFTYREKQVAFIWNGLTSKAAISLWYCRWIDCEVLRHYQLKLCDTVIFFSIFEPLLGVKCMLDSSWIFLSYLVMLVGQWFVIKCPSNSFLTFIVIKLQKDYKQCKMISGFVETLLFYLKKLFVIVFFSCSENYFHALHHYWSLRDTKNCKYVPQTAAVWTKCSKEDKNKMWRMTGSVEYKLSALFTGYSDSAYR